MLYRTDSPEATTEFGRALGERLQPGDVILLSGDLGAGKSVLARGLARGLGIAQAMPSPTFTLMQPYHGRIPFYHFDLYRLEPGTELYEVGFDHDYLAKGISLIEWPERLEGETGDITHKINIEIISENEREVTLEKFDRQ